MCTRNSHDAVLKRTWLTGACLQTPALTEVFCGAVLSRTLRTSASLYSLYVQTRALTRLCLFLSYVCVCVLVYVCLAVEEQIILSQSQRLAVLEQNNPELQRAKEALTKQLHETQMEKTTMVRAHAQHSVRATCYVNKAVSD